MRLFVAQEEEALRRYAEAIADAQECVRRLSEGPRDARGASLLRGCNSVIERSERARTRPVVPPITGPGVGPWIVMGVGAVGLAVFGVTLGFHYARRDALDATCGAGPDRTCFLGTDAEVATTRNTQEDANRFGAVASASLVIGGAAFAAGAGWLVARYVARPARPRPASALLAPTPYGGFLLVGGSF